MQYKCPNCGGGLEFNTEAQNVKCPFCDSEFATEDLKAYDEILSSETEQKQIEWEKEDRLYTEDEKENISVYSCKSCGGEIIADNTTGATHCPYCGNPVIVMGKFADSLKPDLVIPFKIDKESAKKKYYEYISKKFFAPKSFKLNSHIDEIKGLYVPFWLFDAIADGTLRFKGTRVRKWTQGNYDYTETSYFAVVRQGNLGYEAVPVDGASKLDDALMESIGPFEVKDAVDFQTAYLTGFMADRYDVSSQTCEQRASQRIRNDFESEVRNTVHGYTSLTLENSQIYLQKNRLRYALYPVWLLSTTYNGEKYTFAMNGQNGKFIGNSPADSKKVALTSIIASALSTAAAFLIAYFCF